MSEIVKPEGEELLRYLNEGYAICNECGAIMDHELLDNGIANWVCPACGWTVDTSDYEYDYGEDDEDDWFNDDPPEGCIACGGPYPDCMSSCPIFDD